jgi:hypothetical protein
MSAVATVLPAAIQQHPFLYSILTWLTVTFVKSKAPAWKVGLERAIAAVSGLNRLAADALAAGVTDWIRAVRHIKREFRKTLVKSGQEPAKGPDRSQFLTDNRPQEVQRAQVNGLL